MKGNMVIACQKQVLIYGTLYNRVHFVDEDPEEDEKKKYELWIDNYGKHEMCNLRKDFRKFHRKSSSNDEFYAFA